MVSQESPNLWQSIRPSDNPEGRPTDDDIGPAGIELRELNYVYDLTTPTIIYRHWNNIELDCSIGLKEGFRCYYYINCTKESKTTDDFSNHSGISRLLEYSVVKDLPGIHRIASMGPPRVSPSTRRRKCKNYQGISRDRKVLVCGSTSTTS